MRRALVSNPEPDCGIGTKLPCGTVVAVNKDHVLVDTGNESVKTFTLPQIEAMVAQLQIVDA
jgi:hypothetical protein